MKITLDNKSFTSNFIGPILGINKKGKAAIFTTDDNKIYSITATDSNTVFLHNVFEPASVEDPIKRFNIDLSKLQKGLDCIKSSFPFVDFNISLDKGEKALAYADERIKFNIKLVEDNVINIPKFNITVFETLKPTFDIVIPKESLIALKNANSFASDTSKFYIQKEDDNIYIFFGDKQAKHNDDIKVLISSPHNGELVENIFDTTILNLIFKIGEDVTLKIFENKILSMSVIQDNYTLNYITPKLKQ